MPDRTIATIAAEMDQIRTKITNAEATIQAQRSKYTELVREMTTMQSESLAHFGMRIVLENAQDSLPIAPGPSATRRRGRVRQENGHTGEKRTDQDVIREWAVRTNWINRKTGKAPSPKGPVPLQLYKDYDTAHSQVTVVAVEPVEPSPETQEGEQEEERTAPEAPKSPAPRRTRK